MMQPASSTPPMQARTLDLKSISSRLAASVPVQAPVPASLGLQLLAALVAFFQAEGKEFADDRLTRTPFQHLAGKEENDGHRDHIADDGNDVHLPQRQAHGHAHRDRAAQFDQGDHRNKEHTQVFCQHLKTSLKRSKP